MKILWTAAALAGLVTNAHAAPALENLTGVELQRECRKADPEFCRGYIQTVSEDIMTRGVTVCIDTDATSRDDLMDMVVPWIANYSGDQTKWARTKRSSRCTAVKAKAQIKQRALHNAGLGGWAWLHQSWSVRFKECPKVRRTAEMGRGADRRLPTPFLPLHDTSSMPKSSHH